MSTLQPAQVVHQHIASLLRTGALSDLTFTCGGHDFHVHRAIVCVRSAVWKACIEGPFEEASTRTVEVCIADPPALQRALTYLYTGDYDDTNFFATDSTTEEVRARWLAMDRELADVQCAETNASASGLHEPSPVVPDAPPVATSLASPLAPSASLHSTPRQDSPASEDSIDELICTCSTDLDHGPHSVCVNARLRANILVYILADYYQIADLRQLACEKVKTILTTFCHKGFGYICHLVYGSAPPHAADLRSCLSAAIAEKGPQLVQDQDFLQTVLLLPELQRDVYCDLVQLLATCRDERDTAVAQCIDANQRGQADRERVIAQVNSAQRCRHCAKENNVFFERDSAYLGTGFYTFRCKCRTKY